MKRRKDSRLSANNSKKKIGNFVAGSKSIRRSGSRRHLSARNSKKKIGDFAAHNKSIRSRQIKER